MKSQRGITLVEALIGISIIGLVLVFVMYTQNLYFTTSRTAVETTKAMYLAEEGYELIRYLRDEDWNQLASLTNGTTYYFDLSGGAINISNTPEVISSTFTRSFVLAPLRRDANNDFVLSGGTSDTGGRVVTVTVSWGTESVSFDAIVSNIHNI